MILNNADDIKLGSTDVDRVYLGTVIVWERNTVPTHFVFPKNAWQQGGIQPSGSEYDVENRIRTSDYYPIGNYNKIRFVVHDPLYPSYLQWGIQGYNYNNGIYYSTTAYEGGWVSNGDSCDIDDIPASDITHFRVYLRYSDENTITVNDFDYAEYFLSSEV